MRFIYSYVGEAEAFRQRCSRRGPNELKHFRSGESMVRSLLCSGWVAGRCHGSVGTICCGDRTFGIHQSLIRPGTVIKAKS